MHHVVSSQRVEEYLQAIYKLGLHGPVTVTALAQRLGVAAASVSQMVARLRKADLVARSQSRGIVLTAPGKTQALRLVRRHRLSERLLADYLDLPWDKVHNEACQLEHALSDETEARLAARLGEPSTCPHGQPIPDAWGGLHEAAVRPLSELRAGQNAVVARIADEDPELLRRLATLGLLPQASVTVERMAPSDGTLLLRVGMARCTLRRECAEKVLLHA